MTESVGLNYDLYLMPRGRINFRRWHWELWAGPTLLAAGWQTDPLQAQRTLRIHAVRYAHRVHGLRVLRPDVEHPPETPWNGRRVRISWGEMEIELNPLTELQTRRGASTG
jgi:hypothetical protein